MHLKRPNDSSDQGQEAQDPQINIAMLNCCRFMKICDQEIVLQRWNRCLIKWRQPRQPRAPQMASHSLTQKVALSYSQKQASLSKPKILRLVAKCSSIWHSMNMLTHSSKRPSLKRTKKSIIRLRQACVSRSRLEKSVKKLIRKESQLRWLTWFGHLLLSRKPRKTPLSARLSSN